MGSHHLYKWLEHQGSHRCHHGPKESFEENRVVMRSLSGSHEQTSDRTDGKKESGICPGRSKGRCVEDRKSWVHSTEVHLQAEFLPNIPSADPVTSSSLTHSPGTPWTATTLLSIVSEPLGKSLAIGIIDFLAVRLPFSRIRIR
jgi:hypothetical protein